MSFFGAAVIDLTPLPNMPLDFNGVIVTTDDNGEFNVSLEDTGNYSIVSGLPKNSGVQAVYFDEIVGTGGQLAAQSPYTIEMARRIFVTEPVCRGRRNGSDVAIFHYNNTASVSLAVPLQYGSLNQILSPSGNLAPPATFATGESSFYLPLDGFATDATYAGKWNITGQSLAFDDVPPLCPDDGDGQCNPVNGALFDNVWLYTSRVVQSQIAKAKLLTGKTWRPAPNQRLFVFNRGSKALSALRHELDRYDGALICPTPTAASCSLVRVDRAAIRSLFNKLFQGTPAGLSKLDAPATAQKAGLAKLLQDLPDTVTVCDGP